MGTTEPRRPRVLEELRAATSEPRFDAQGARFCLEQRGTHGPLLACFDAEEGRALFAQRVREPFGGAAFGRDELLWCCERDARGAGVLRAFAVPDGAEVANFVAVRDAWATHALCEVDPSGALAVLRSSQGGYGPQRLTVVQLREQRVCWSLGPEALGWPKHDARRLQRDQRPHGRILPAGFDPDGLGLLVQEQERAVFSYVDLEGMVTAKAGFGELEQRCYGARWVGPRRFATVSFLGELLREPGEPRLAPPAVELRELGLAAPLWRAPLPLEGLRASSRREGLVRAWPSREPHRWLVQSCLEGSGGVVTCVCAAEQRVVHQTPLEEGEVLLGEAEPGRWLTLARRRGAEFRVRVREVETGAVRFELALGAPELSPQREVVHQGLLVNRAGDRALFSRFVREERSFALRQRVALLEWG